MCMDMLNRVIPKWDRHEMPLEIDAVEEAITSHFTRLDLVSILFICIVSIRIRF